MTCKVLPRSIDIIDMLILSPLGPATEQDQCKERSEQRCSAAYIIIFHKLQGLREDLGGSDVAPQGLGKARQLLTHANTDDIVDILAHGETSPQEMLLHLYMQHNLISMFAPGTPQGRGGANGANIKQLASVCFCMYAGNILRPALVKPACYIFYMAIKVNDCRCW